MPTGLRSNIFHLIMSPCIHPFLHNGQSGPCNKIESKTLNTLRAHLISYHWDYTNTSSEHFMLILNFTRQASVHVHKM